MGSEAEAEGLVSRKSKDTTDGLGLGNLYRFQDSEHGIVEYRRLVRTTLWNKRYQNSGRSCDFLLLRPQVYVEIEFDMKKGISYNRNKAGELL